MTEINSKENFIHILSGDIIEKATSMEDAVGMLKKLSREKNLSGEDLHAKVNEIVSILQHGMEQLRDQAIDKANEDGFDGLAKMMVMITIGPVSGVISSMDNISNDEWIERYGKSDELITFLHTAQDVVKKTDDFFSNNKAETSTPRQVLTDFMGEPPEYVVQMIPDMGWDLVGMFLCFMLHNLVESIQVLPAHCDNEDNGIPRVMALTIPRLIISGILRELKEDVPQSDPMIFTTRVFQHVDNILMEAKKSIRDLEEKAVG